VKVLRKDWKKKKVYLRTVCGDAREGFEFIKVDKKVEFDEKEESKMVSIELLDSKGQELDEEFYIELYADKKAKNRLIGTDTRATVTLVDNDHKPPVICFKHRGTLEI
jgi:hypothetical protein